MCFYRNPDSGSRDSVCRDSVCRDSVGKPRKRLPLTSCQLEPQVLGIATENILYVCLQVPGFPNSNELAFERRPLDFVKQVSARSQR